MKIQLLFLLGVFLISYRLSAQMPDPQWLISDGKGKSSYTTSGNVFGNSITGPFALRGVSAPNRLNPNAKNDILLIYRDGQNYHTRNMTTTNPFFRSTSISTGTTHTFSPTHTSPVMYMYLSNRYERDDLPDNVAVSNVSSGSYAIDRSSIPILSANNSVVPNKDLTLILSLDSVPPTTKLSLTYNGIAPYSTSHNLPIQHTLDVLAPQAAFTYGGSFVPEYASGQGLSDFSVAGTISINDAQGIRYFNFRPTEAANAFMPDENGPRYEVEFALRNPSGVITTIREPMLYSQDPNFLRVDSIEKVSDGYLIYYHLEFENVGEIPTGELAVKVKFPAFIEVDQVQPFKWYAGGANCDGTIDLKGDSITFDFIGENPLEMCFEGNTNICKGFVEFKAKVKDGNDVRDPNFSLRLFTPQVFFLPSSFPLHEFRDLIRYEDGKYFRLVNESNRPLPPDTWWERWKCEILIALGLIFLLVLIIFLATRRRNNP